MGNCPPECHQTPDVGSRGVITPIRDRLYHSKIIAENRGIVDGLVASELCKVISLMSYSTQPGYPSLSSAKRGITQLEPLSRFWRAVGYVKFCKVVLIDLLMFPD